MAVTTNNNNKGIMNANVDTFSIDRNLLIDYNSMTTSEKLKTRITNGVQRLFKPRSEDTYILKGKTFCNQANEILSKTKTLEAYKEALECMRSAKDQFVKSNDVTITSLCSKNLSMVQDFYHLRVEQRGDSFYNQGEAYNKVKKFKEAEKAYFSAAEQYHIIPLTAKENAANSKAKENHRLGVLQDANNFFADGDRKFASKQYYDAETAYKNAASCYRELNMLDKEKICKQKATASFKEYNFIYAEDYYNQARNKLNDKYYYSAKGLFIKAYNCYIDAGRNSYLKNVNDKIEYCKAKESECYENGNRLYNRGKDELNNGQYASAVNLFEKAAYQYRCSEDKKEYSWCQEKIQTCEYGLQADEKYSKAITNYNEGSRSIDPISCYIVRDASYYKKAKQYFAEARDLYDRIGRNSMVSKCDRDINDCYDELGMIKYNIAMAREPYDGAISDLEEAIEYFRLSGNESKLKECENRINYIRYY